MAKILLRSGSLDDFQPVGGGGQAVFTSALQIRETLRLRNLSRLAECLAIPQVNDDGNRVDWYSPIAGSVVSWKSADDNQRRHALQQLNARAEEALTLSRNCRQSDNTTRQLFGALLEKTLQFPGENHLFLVDGKPVITFWGFVNLNESVRDDLFESLQTAPQVAISQPLSIIIEESEEKDHKDVVHEEPVTESPAAESPQPASIQTRKPHLLPFWSLPVAAVVVAAVAVPLMRSHHTPPASTEIASAEPAVVVVPPAWPALHAALPLQQASFIPATEKEKPVMIAAIPKDVLIMDASEMRAGTTHFLNGRWRVLAGIKDPATGKTLLLRYQIDHNKGSAHLVYGNNVTCKAEIFSGLHKNGELLIKNRSHARCSDGSRYPLPEISCKSGLKDIAECTGRFDANTVVPLTFRKVGA